MMIQKLCDMNGHMAAGVVELLFGAQTTGKQSRDDIRNFVAGQPSMPMTQGACWRTELCAAVLSVLITARSEVTSSSSMVLTAGSNLCACCPLPAGMATVVPLSPA